MPQVGDQVGRFTIQRLLGKGGMGSVYVAEDRLLKVQVALKFLSASMQDEQAFARFSREVLLARRVTHPGICRIFDIHEEQGHRFISLEYVEGPTLYATLREHGQLPPVDAARVARSLSSALGAAHAKGIVHRDLKPSNLVVPAPDRVTVLDFGLSTAFDLDSITAAGMQVGTFFYISPERARGDPASAQCDIYSLGIILYECLTGRLPYRGTQLAEVLVAIEAGNVVPPRHYNDQVPEALEKIVLRAIAVDPGERYADVGEIKRDLDAFFTEQQADFDPSLDSSVSGPWDRDIESSVQAVLLDPMASAVIRSHMRDTTILFSDIVGITPYFDRHGDVAGMRKIQLHNRLLFPVIQAHGGRVIKTIGDAIMACFEEAEQGVTAAMEMQQTLRSYNRDVEGDEQIEIRIGLHSGTSIFDNDDVFGDSVNVAARVSGKAEGGQILISQATRVVLQETVSRTSHHGSAELKGKEERYELFLVDWQTVAEPGPIPGESDEFLPDAATSVDRALPEEVASSLEPAAGDDFESGTEVETGAPLPQRRRSPVVVLVGGSALVAIVAGVWITIGGATPPEVGPGEAGHVSVVRDDLTDNGREPQPVKPQPVKPEPAKPEPAKPEPAKPEPAKPEPARPVEPDRKPPTVEPDRLPPGLNRPDRGERPGKGVRERLERGAELKRLTRQVERDMRKKGLIRGDVKELDQQRQLMARGSPDGRLVAGQKALAIIDRVAIDRTFLEAKINRLNRSRDWTTDPRLKEKFEKVVNDYFLETRAGRYQAANRLLNGGFNLR